MKSEQIGLSPGERLSNAGRWLVDAKGRVAIIHGFNIINKLTPYTLPGAGFGEEDAAILARKALTVCG